MPKILEILYKEMKRSTAGEIYFRTHAILDNGQEAVGFGKDFEVGDKVGYWFDEKHNVTKMRKGSLTLAEKNPSLEKPNETQ